MKRLLASSASAAVAVAAFAAAFMLVGTSACSDPPPKPAPTHGYLGAAACRECHEERFAGFVRTGHHNTSSRPSPETILGSFDAPRNVMLTSNPALSFEMTRDGHAFRQTARSKEAGGRETTRSEAFDMVVGSGKLGQTYLWWKDDRLFQLPVSWYRGADSWLNSPGEIYPDGTANFDRTIHPRCLECHATWIESRPGLDGNRPEVNAYDPDSAILGISCERCHGPGAEHVAWHKANPGSETAHRIVNPAELPRERSLDLCGQCHGGVGQPVRPAFSFRPGYRLEDFIRPPVNVSAAPALHSANQLRRLQQSRCFLESGTLTCVSCHDPHKVERGDDALFSKRCMACHTPEKCPECVRGGHGAETNCIACHMVREEVKGMTMATKSGTEQPVMADHHIRIDAAATERFRAAASRRK